LRPENPVPTAQQPPSPLRSSGRPRNPNAERAILHATLELLAAEGYAAMSIEAVASRAGVSKATIYRRWATKLHVVLAAVKALSTHPLPELTSGQTRDDLVLLLRHMIEALTTTVAGRVLPALIDEVARTPELRGALNDFWISRRALMVEVLRAGSENGHLPHEVDHELIADLLYGAVHYRFLISSTPLSADLPERLVEAVLDGPAVGGGGDPLGDAPAVRRGIAGPGALL
jgi:AcrR family transcriptional regulator